MFVSWFPQMQCFHIFCCDLSSCVQKGPHVTDKFSFFCWSCHARRSIYSLNVEYITVLHGYELKKHRKLHTVYVCNEVCLMRMFWVLLESTVTADVCEAVGDFVSLFVLSNSGDVSCSAVFKPYSYILYIYSLLLCCDVLPPYFFSSFKLIY